jgi:DNA polymerase-3 subunit beta
MTAFTIDAGMLSAAAGWVSRACPAKPAAPILGGMLIDVADSEVRLTAYDYETAATATLPIMLGDPGRVVVSGRLLAAVAQAATKAPGKTSEVTFTADGPTATAKAGKSADWTLPTMPVEDYPRVPGSEVPDSDVSGDELRHALARVLPAVDRGGQVPALGGVQFSADGDALTVTATDRWRLATAVLPWKPHGADLPDAVVPFDLLEATSKALAGGGTAHIGVTGGSFTAATDTHILTGRIIDAAYPAWRKLMPSGRPQTAAVVVAGALSRAVEQASVMLESVRAVRLAFDAHQVEVSVAGDDRSAHAHADISDYRGDPFTVAVNPDYFKGAIAGCGSDLIEFQFGANESRPILLLPVAPNGSPSDDYRHLLMPVKP